MHSAVQGFTGHFEAMPGSDDLFLKLPDAFLNAEDWRSNDVLLFEIQSGQIFVVNKSKVSREEMGGRNAPLT